MQSSPWRGPAPDAPDLDHETVYRLRTVRVGLILTVLVVAGLALWPLTPSAEVTRPGVYYLLLAAGITGAVVVGLLPWRALFERGWGVPAMYIWSIADIVLITGLIAVTGGATSLLFIVYVFTTVFFAASYPLRGQVGLAAFTSVAYIAGSAIAGNVAYPPIAFRLLMLALIAYMAGFLSRELLAVSEKAQRRGRLLSQVATASRHLHSLDPDVVLSAAVDAALDLGWDVVSLELVDEQEPGRAVVRHARGLPDDYPLNQPLDKGMLALLVREEAPIVTDEYGSLPGASEDVIRLGVAAAVAVPVRVRGELAGALFAGALQARPVAAVDVEALELLGAAVSLALDNAAAYADQQQAAERLAAIDQAKGDFILTASHELRTPMTVASGMAQTLRQRYDELDDNARQMLLERMSAGLERLGGLVTTLVDYARASVTETPAATPTPVSVPVQTAATRVMREAPSRPVTVHFDEVSVHADALLLVRVLEQLLRNAVTHTPETASVRLTAHRDGDGWVRFTVADSGPGMTAAQLRAAEERFARGGDIDERPAGGLGLGLPLARRLLASQGADLTLESSPEAGTTATFALPIAEPTTALRVGEGSSEHG